MFFYGLFKQYCCILIIEGESMENIDNLTLEEKERLTELLANFQLKSVQQYENLNKFINLFQNQEIVNSFFKSSNYSLNKQESLKEICSSLNKYYTKLIEGNNSLLAETKNYLNNFNAKINDSID